MKKQISKTQKQSITPSDLLQDIRALIVSARKAVVRNVDTIQVITNFEIGRRIVEHEQKGSERADYGEKILKKLSQSLTKEFGRGFSERNLEYMRKFYSLYQNRFGKISQMASAKLVNQGKSQKVSGKSQKIQTASGQLAMPVFSLNWSQYVFLLGVKDDDARSFYEIESADNGWTLPELTRQFNSGLYERLVLSRDKKGIKELSQKGQIIQKPEDLLKEPYVLEFLGLDENTKYSESDMESAIINKLEHFLLELGKGFLFEARQKRFSFDEDHFFVDLVFYNRLLRCYVLVDLKIGKLTHQDLGQMQMYVNYFDRYEKTDEENPTVGIILCHKNNEAVVEITLPKDANIHAKEYKLYLPSKAQLKRKLLAWTEDKDVSR